MASTIVGSGAYTYRVEESWAKLPTGWEFGDVGAVGIDPRIASTCSIAANIRCACSIATETS